MTAPPFGGKKSNRLPCGCVLTIIVAFSMCSCQGGAA